MSYEAIHLCVKCKGELNYRQRMHSHGVCPLCGWVGSSPTICDTVRYAAHYGSSFTNGQASYNHPHDHVLDMWMCGLLAAAAIFGMFYVGTQRPPAHELLLFLGGGILLVDSWMFVHSLHAHRRQKRLGVVHIYDNTEDK